LSVSLGIGLFAISLLAALAALALASRWPAARGREGGLFAEGEAGAVFIFDDETLIDASAGGRAILNAVRAGGSPWQRFLAFAQPRFPEVEARLARLREAGCITLAATGNDPLTLRAEWRGGLRRIALTDARLEPAFAPYDSLIQAAQDAELRLLREATDRAPVPVWHEEAAGGIVWANDAYMALAVGSGAAPDEGAWPPPPLFDPAAAAGRQRLALAAGPGERWFDCAGIDTAGGRILYALPADAAVQAEQALRDVVQTLALAFAHLPVGLAVFDSERRLLLFNPALTDLTALPAEFLAARPTLTALLDALRERRMLPEPRDYKRWRQRIAGLGAPADPAPIEETWSLAGERTYRVHWRPHPKGAVALLIEDISDEMRRLRSVRADLALGQSVVDALNDAIAVIDADGTLVQTNAAYAGLWGEPAAGAAAGTGAAGAAGLVRRWAAQCAPDPAWEALETALARPPPGEDRAGWEGTVRMLQGRALHLRLRPIGRGARLLVFTPVPRTGIALAASDGIPVAEVADGRPATAG
jgi:PAS domain-containing protein